MKQTIKPGILIAIVAGLLIGISLIFWKTTGGRSEGQGRLESDLDTSKMEKNPAEFQKELDALIARDKAAHKSK